MARDTPLETAPDQLPSPEPYTAPSSHPASPAHPPLSRSSDRSRGWLLFDAIVDRASQTTTSPWVRDDGRLVYRPDFATLELLLGVPLRLGAPTTSGVPALALDVWLVYELHRAGFASDVVWPRPSEPRILPGPIAELVKSLPKRESEELRRRLETSKSLRSAAPSEARILGKNYEKQVDVLMSHWSTGPELMISTKRMDSSFGKNAPNRIEEAYGDAKNLRLRHPLAAIGFFFGIRSTVFSQAPMTAEWIVDLMQKLSREDDAYGATCLLPMEYSEYEGGADHDDAGDQPVEAVLEHLPAVTVQEDLVPENVRTSVFLGRMIQQVLSATPVTHHVTVRERIKSASRKEKS
jgi:hypothetical protein